MNYQISFILYILIENSVFFILRYFKPHWFSCSWGQQLAMGINIVVGWYINPKGIGLRT